MPQVSLPTLVAQVRSGALVSFPTDTVPALGIRPDRADRLFAVKQRQPDKPLILMAATIAELWPYVTGSPAERQNWQQLAEQYLPGALTLVLPASDRVPPTMNPQQTTIGIRVPNHAVAIAILTQTGALATTSANRSGQPALQTIPEIAVAFPQAFTLLPSETEEAPTVDRANHPSGVPSTVIRWTGEEWEILRQGAVWVD